MSRLNDLYSSEYTSALIIPEVVIEPSTDMSSAWGRLRTTHTSVALKDATVHDARTGEVYPITPTYAQYADRGWCFFEMTITMMFQRVQAADEFARNQMYQMAMGMFGRAFSMTFPGDGRAFTNAADRDFLPEEFFSKSFVERVFELIEGKSRWEEVEVAHQRGDIALVTVGFLRRLAARGSILPRRQDLPLDVFAKPTAQELRSRELFAISHPWCAAYPSMCQSCLD